MCTSSPTLTVRNLNRPTLLLEEATTRGPDMDYKSTLNLPKTDFPMRANLPQREPAVVARYVPHPWQ